MIRVLIVKMSSLGDVSHTFPAISDLKKQQPSTQIDWLVEPSFANIVKLHPAVNEIIPISLRALRKKGLSGLFSGEWRQLFRGLRRLQYDYIIDAQGLWKSALMAKLVCGHTIGLDYQSAREGSASFCYQKKISVSKNMLAIKRTRQLFAKAFHYSFDDSKLDFGLQVNVESPKIFHKPYVVFLHGTTWINKHWPEQHWRQLAQQAVSCGYQVGLPFGNEQERHRAERIANLHDDIQVLPAMELTQLAAVLKLASAIVAVDTGLAHLAGALDTPIVTLYGPTDAKKTGTQGNSALNLQASYDCSPCLSRQCLVKTNHSIQPPCFAELTAQSVWENLETLLENKERQTCPA